MTTLKYWDLQTTAAAAEQLPSDEYARISFDLSSPIGAIYNSEWSARRTYPKNTCHHVLFLVSADTSYQVIPGVLQDENTRRHQTSNEF